MKVLLIIDTIEFLHRLEKDGDNYRYGSIRITVIHYASAEDLTTIKDLLQKERFHLVLTLTLGTFYGSYILPEHIASSINNYLSLSLRSDTRIFQPEDIEKPPISIVNRSTAYFNVFLEIQKAVSLTTHQKFPDLDLPRLDIVSSANYYFAYILDRNRCNYYLLNYSNTLPSEVILDILTKIE